MFGSPFLHNLYSGRNVYSEILHTERINKNEDEQKRSIIKTEEPFRRCRY